MASEYLLKAIQHLRNIPNRTPGQESALRGMEEQLRKEQLGLKPGDVDWSKQPPLQWDAHGPSKSPTHTDWLRQPHGTSGMTNYEWLLSIQKSRTQDISNWYAEKKASGLFKIASDGKAELGSPSVLQHFRGITASEMATGNFVGPVVFTDIETGHMDQPISVAAVKGVVDRRTGEFRVVDVLEKYYTPKNPASALFNISRETHGLTPKKIATLRAMQGATYSTEFNETEKAELLRFMKGSLIGGQNVEEFDFERLGIAQGLQSEGIIDTLVAAENLGVKKGQRGLSKLFKRYTGMTMEQAGLSHHIGMHDVLANIDVYTAMYRMKNKTGRDIRFVTENMGYSYGKYEEHAGTAIIKGGYFRGRGKGGPSNYMYEDEFDERGVFEYEYDENGRKILPDGYAWAGEIDEEEGRGAAVAHIMGAEFSHTFKALQEELQRVRESTIGYKVAQQNALVRYLANKDEDIGKAYLKKLGYNEETVDKMMKQAIPLRIARERKRSESAAQITASRRAKADEFVQHLYRSGALEKNDWLWLTDVNNDSTGFTPSEIVDMARERKASFQERQKAAHERVLAREEAEFGNWRSFARDLTESDPSPFNRDEALKRIRYLDKLEKNKSITSSQRASLDNLSGSFEDLVDATDQVVEANQRLMKTYKAIADIKPYDINHLISTAHTQWSGVTGAARGVVPEFIRNPISRLGNAALNAVDRSVSPWNAVQRTWNSGIGAVITGGLTAGMGPVGFGIGSMLTGGVNAVTQVGGNAAQAKLEMFGLSLQNNLNTLGAMVSWISTPFQLLHKALKLATGSLGGFTFKLNNIMGNGINLMSQMGNPLTELTGMNYGAYAGSTMMDFASLLNKGSTNSAIEDFAYQQQGLYLGRLNTNRLIASSMLGVYGDVYGRGGNAQESYNTVANKLLARLNSGNPEDQAWAMFLANDIGGNLPSLLRSARLLGVSDVNQLTNPKNRGMYWTPMSNAEERNFRWTQYEYSAAKEQFGFSKMRLANTLWRAGGKSIYNAFNELVDTAASGNWEAAIKRASAMWEEFRQKFSGVWESIKAGFKGEDGEDNSLMKTIKGIGLTLENVLLKGAQKIVTVWDTILGAILEKMQGLVAYLSTIRIEPTFEHGKLGFKMTNIGDVSASDADKIWTQSLSGQMGVVNKVNENMGGIAQLYDMLFPNATDYMKDKATIGDIRAKFASLRAAGMNTIGLSSLGIEQMGTDEESVNDLLNLLVRREVEDMGPWAEAGATWLMPTRYNTKIDKQSVYNKTGLADAYHQLVDPTEGILDNIISSKLNDNYARVDLYFRDSTGKKALIGADSKGSVFTKDIVLLQQMVPRGMELVVNQVK
jgi:hypothetical protein